MLMLTSQQDHNSAPGSRSRLALAFFIGLFFGCSSNPRTVDAPQPDNALVPPVAERIRHAVTSNGVELVDDYFWLRERDNPKVRAYLAAENRYTAAVMAHTRGLQDKLFQEMKGRIKEADVSAPVHVDNYWYYSRTEEGKQYWVFCRKKGSLDAAEEVLLDVNRLAEGKDFFAIGTLAVSPDHAYLAYSFDESGNEQYTLRVKNLSTGNLLDDHIDKIGEPVEWGNDNRTLFYVVRDPTERPYRVLRHQLGNTDADAVVYDEPDERFYVSLDKSKSKKYIFVELASQITSEVRYLDADAPTSELRLFRPREQGVEYDIEHHTDWFYVVTNEGAKNFKLMKTRVDDVAPAHWKEVIAHKPEVKLDGIDVFRKYLVVYERKNGLTAIEVWNLASGEHHDIAMDEPVYTVSGDDNDDNPEFEASTLRFSYTSLITPPTTYDYDMNTRQRQLMKREEVRGGHDVTQYQSERIFATASDGTRVPVSLVYKKGARQPGGNPCLLLGYGAYGVSYDPEFSLARLSLLDRGFVVAIAHIRGGGEMGRYWYEDGKLLAKKNTFGDFIAAMESLIAQGYTTQDKLAIMGGSAGGLLMGAVVNMRPDLMKAVVAEVPFVDVMNTMLDTSLPLTVIEFEEWGNPSKQPYFDYMRSYSPYDNVTARTYPNMLITAGLNDTRVSYWEPAKWTARLRATKTDNNRLILDINMGAGHSGASGRFDSLHETALQYAFILDVLGMTN